MKDPQIDGAMINRESTFLHQFFNLPVTKGVRQIPTNALQYHIFLEMRAFEGYGYHGGLPENCIKLTHPAICDRTKKNDSATISKDGERWFPLTDLKEKY